MDIEFIAMRHVLNTVISPIHYAAFLNKNIFYLYFFT